MTQRTETKQYQSPDERGFESHDADIHYGTDTCQRLCNPLPHHLVCAEEQDQDKTVEMHSRQSQDVGASASDCYFPQGIPVRPRIPQQQSFCQGGCGSIQCVETLREDVEKMHSFRR